MLKNLLLAVVALIPVASSALTWTLQDREYNVDTLFHAKIGPGTTQTSLALSGAQSLRVFYTTTDLTDPYVDIRVTKAGNKYVGCQTLSAQRAASDREGARYFAGVNADFFGNSSPIGSTVVDGEVINTANNTWVNWYMTDDKKPAFGALGYNGTATFPSGATHAVAGINCGRGENQLIVYNNRYNGSTSGTNSYGCEVAIRPVEGDLGFAGKSVYEVTSSPETAGSMAIPADGYVLSGHGTAAALVSALTVGQRVNLDLYPSMDGKKIWQMASGLPIILQNGKTLDTQTALDHLTSLNPRTAIGFNADGTRLVLLVVDGRSGISVGVVSRVLADLMREVGCTEAMNFDGGGSSEMYTSAFGVRNQPSDGRERAVTNAVWCVAQAPDDDEVAAISFVQQSVTLPKYGFFTPQIYAYNKYGMLINTDLTGFTLSCDPSIGTIVDDGITLFANGTGYKALTATYNGISCSVPVLIGAGDPHARLESVIVDSYKDYKTEVTATVNGLEMPIDNVALTWHSEDNAIASVDETGLIHGVSDGKTNIVGTVEGKTVSLPVTVQIPDARWMTVDPVRDMNNWTLIGSGVKKENNPVKVDDVSFALPYTISSTRSPYIGAKADVEIASCPDSIRVAFDPGTATVKSVVIAAKSNVDRLKNVTVTQDFPQETTSVITVAVNDFVTTPDDFANYPITFSSIKFNLGDAASSSHTITVKALQAVHIALPMSSGGVNDVVADAVPDAAVSYYTTGGVRVSGKLEPGVYIRRQGNTGTKILVK